MQVLRRAKAEVAELEDAIAKTRSQELASLPAKYGFDSAKDFVAAVLSAAGGTRPAKSTRPPKAKRSRKRAEITAAMRNKVVELCNAGRTGSEIASAVGISLPSVQNIKKAAGLVRARARKTRVTKGEKGKTIATAT